MQCPKKIKVLLVYNRSISSFTAYPWMLARNGKCTVDVLSPWNHPVRSSKWVHEAFVFSETGDLVMNLKDLLRNRSYDAMLMVDESTRNLVLPERHDPILSPFMPFPIDSTLNEACMNKADFHAWCRSHQIPCPEGRSIESLEGARAAAMEIGLPCILKGSTSSGGDRVFVVEDLKQIDAIIEMNPGESNWLVQEFITGEVGSTSFVAREGKLFATCSSYKHVSQHGGLGPSSIRRFLASSALEKIAEAVVKAGSISGVSGFDWMQAGPEDFKVIDPHLGRGTTSVVASDRDGVDIGEAFYASLRDGERQPRQKGSGLIIWMMPQSLTLVFEGWLFRSLRKANPLSAKVGVFWCGTGDGRVLRQTAIPIIFGQIRVLLGAFRQKLFQFKGRSGRRAETEDEKPG